MARSGYTIVCAEVVGDHKLRLTFLDGVVGVVDLSQEQFDGALADLADQQYFARVSVDPFLGTVVWPNGEDLAPDALHDDVLAGVTAG